MGCLIKPVGIKVAVLFLLGILKQVQFLGPVHHTQKHRIARVGRDLLRLSSLTSLLKQGQLEQIAQEYEFNTRLPTATENCSGMMGQGNETRNKHGSNAVAHRVQACSQP